MQRYTFFYISSEKIFTEFTSRESIADRNESSGEAIFNGILESSNFETPSVLVNVSQNICQYNKNFKKHVDLPNNVTEN